ncbi:radical SAM protein [Ornithobacterium rhinotracheale]|uniref:radical SAM/SPASM domain-containing protein n=1 Tax=Ornithobacterium rhinotracheale TaxID=28251 RepID=UPI00129CAC89|nr:radical SAM protein [Ornithobacterium rhinotracheale]MRI64587.1 radical SAM protein [Ornithobacterium rhinotracheale]
MKSSLYNIFFNYEDKIVVYNSLSDNFMVLENILYELLEASIKCNEINEIKNYHDSFYEELKDNGFIIEDNVNELDIIKKISYDTDFNETKYSLTINPTMNCNFKCWYCYESHIKSSKINEETQKKILKLIDNIVDEKRGKLKYFHISWFGGEPLLYFNKTILPLLREVSSKMEKENIHFTTNFTSNGYLLNQNIISDCKRFNTTNFQITLDGHRDRHNKVRFLSKTRGSYDEIVNNIKLCLKNKLRVNARINVSHETLIDLLHVIEDFMDVSTEEKKYLTFSFHEVWQEEKNLHEDISNIVSSFRKKGFKVDYKGEINRAIYNSCYADKLNQATINYNGDIFKCTARDFKSSSKEGVLEEDGTISWNNIYYKRIYKTRFMNKPCLSCKILPICNGGCSQHRIENEGKSYCIYNFDEKKKKEIVKEKFFSRLYSQVE